MIFKKTLNLIFTLLTFIVVSQNKVCETSEENNFLRQNTIEKCLAHGRSVEENKNQFLISTRKRFIRRYNTSSINKKPETDATDKKTELVSTYNYEAYSNVQHITLRLINEIDTLESYIIKNVNYPYDNIEGEIFVRFIVDKEGYIKDMTSTGFKNSELLQEEVKSVIKRVSKITPIKLNNKFVDAEYYLPIVFALD